MRNTVFVVQLPFPSLDYFPEPRYFGLEQEWFRAAVGKDFTIPEVGIWEVPWWVSWVSASIRAAVQESELEIQVKNVDLSRVKCDLESVCRALPKGEPGDLYCFSPLTQNFALATAVASELRDTARKSAMGGPMSEHARQGDFDFIFRGRIETQWDKFNNWLVEALNLSPGDLSHPANADSLAKHLNHSWVPKTYQADVNYLRTYTLHGCPFACSFCADRLTGPDPVAANLLRADLFALASNFPGRSTLYIGDLTFGVSRPTIVTLKSLLRETADLFGRTFRLIVQTNASLINERFAQELVELGVAVVEMGIESGSPEAVRRTQKRRPSGHWLDERIQILHDHGIRVAGNIIVGLPEDGEQEFAQTEEFMLRWRRQMWFHVYGFVPYPGTPLYDRLVRDGRILEWDMQKWCECADWIFRPYNVSIQKAREWLIHLLRVAVGDTPTRPSPDIALRPSDAVLNPAELVRISGTGQRLDASAEGEHGTNGSGRRS